MTWSASTLGDVVEGDGGLIQTGPFGSQLHQADYVTEGIPVIMPKDIAGGRVDSDSVARVSEETARRLGRHQLQSRTIVLPRRGEITKRAFIRDDQAGWLCGTGCLQIALGGKQLLPEFLYYYLEQEVVVRWLEQHAVGTTMLNLSATIVAALPIKYPVPAAQQRIAEILCAYDDLIENNRRRMALLESAAGQLYREWFVRLRFPGSEHTRVSDGVPEGWERTSVGGLVEEGVLELQTGPFGTQLHAADYVEEGTPVINVRNIGYGTLRAEKLEFVGEDVVDRLARHTLRAGDIVFGRKGAVDRHLLVLPAQKGWMQGSDCIRLRPLGDRATSVFLSLGFREEQHKEWILVQCSNKATMASLNQEVIARIPLLVPNRMLLQEFSNVAGEILAQVGALQRQSDKAAAARNLLLPRLMSGELAV